MSGACPDLVGVISVVNSADPTGSNPPCALTLLYVLRNRSYRCWLTDKTFPSGSLNHATLSPPGVVHIPRSLSATHGYFSVSTPGPTSQPTIAPTSPTSHPSTVLRSGTKSAIFTMRTRFSPARMINANGVRATNVNPSSSLPRNFPLGPFVSSHGKAARNRRIVTQSKQ